MAHYAAMNGDMHITQRLHQLGVDFSQVNGNGVSPAHPAALNDHDEWLKWAYDQCLNLSIQDGLSGQTPLHWAAERNQINAAMALLDAGVDPSPRDRYDFTPAMTAREQDHHALADLLIARIVDDEQRMLNTVLDRKDPPNSLPAATRRRL